MIELNDQQLDFLEQEIKDRGIQHENLAHGLLDHFACGIEREMAEGLGFYEAYHKVYMQVSPNGLEEIDQSMTLVIIHQKYSNMKKSVFILGFVTAFIFFVGYIFKSQHWPTANNLILIGSTIFALGFLPAYFYLKYKSDKEMGNSKPIMNYVFNLLLVIVLALALPYKQFKWQGHEEIFMIGQALLAFVFLPKVFLGWYKKFSQTAAVG
jgi:hypothetical protein